MDKEIKDDEFAPQVWAITLDWSNPEKIKHFSMNESQLVIHFQLVGGAITILKNMSSSMGRMTSHI